MTPPISQKQIQDARERAFIRPGITITQWAQANGFDRNEVYRVLNGQCKGLYGRGHEILVALGLKPQNDQRIAA